MPHHKKRTSRKDGSRKRKSRRRRPRSRPRSGTKARHGIRIPPLSRDEIGRIEGEEEKLGYNLMEKYVNRAIVKHELSDRNIPTMISEFIDACMKYEGMNNYRIRRGSDCVDDLYNMIVEIFSNRTTFIVFTDTKIKAYRYGYTSQKYIRLITSNNEAEIEYEPDHGTWLHYGHAHFPRVLSPLEVKNALLGCSRCEIYYKSVMYDREKRRVRRGFPHGLDKNYFCIIHTLNNVFIGRYNDKLNGQLIDGVVHILNNR